MMPLAARIARAQADPQMIATALALRKGQLDVAERTLRARLRDDPADMVAMRMLAELAGRIGRYRDSEALLQRALALAPDFHAARANLVTVLHRQSRFIEALAEAERLIRDEPHEHGHLALRAAVRVRTGAYDGALEDYRSLLARHPDQARLWISCGHVLKTIGDRAGAVEAYRTAIRHEPTLGDAWWSLANLKTEAFSSDDIAAMQVALADASDRADHYHLHFALGRALEQRGDHGASFVHYAQGNRLRREELPYKAQWTSAHVDASIALLTGEALARRSTGGHLSREPIFVVGLPRSGSTLIEQILASHPDIEGTMELPDIGTIAAGLRAGGREDTDESGYLPQLLELDAAQRHALGQRYLDGTRIQRQTDRPRYIDKMPNNFQHVGLIHCILPNAVVIDARRHPVANCFSAFKQHFSRGQGFTYHLGDLARYWCDYERLMAHFDAVLPGRVCRVYHERLLADPEAEVRALLAHIGLAFDPACLTPHRTQRPVRTASSEQVRQPISRTPDRSWQQYRPWLGALETALEPAVARYPQDCRDA
ncbi:tetratricopeptide repeat-containing sulfotransferase family protein [Blastomonas sp. UPD001]|uniref:tetratricopeptide repeat-containing sulfotransferase family protein n=1 Tax=Blastomonas sp. UPD001 TaxID=2217673 RepID=UPI001E5C3F0C|nr:tetratricopeptide repeat-containing sulfotransferase family protein [Blastomonas sp. UPD001]